MRDRIRAGKLRAHKDLRGQWRIVEADLPTYDATSASGLLARVEQLTRDLDEIRAYQLRDAERAANTVQERDRLRVEATSAREAALILNGAAQDVRTAMTALLNALDAQSDALTQLLAPGSPQDLAAKSTRR